MNIDDNKLILPNRLLPGDKIGIVAPASPFDIKEFERGISVLESMGFCTSIPSDLFNKTGYLAGTDKQRADLINKFFSDKSIKAIFCARGGFGSIKILSLLDFESIRKNPKVFIGFSDISAILAVLYKKCRFITFHGPTVTSLKDASDETKKAILSAISSDMPIEIRPKTRIKINSGSVRGSVSGGNLTTLCHLIGTPFEPCYKGHILLLEERGEATYKIDRMLTHMKLAGCFNELAGLVLGSFTDCGENKNIYKIVADIFDDINIPVLAGFEFGHSTCNITIPLGIHATLDADRYLLHFHELATV